MSNEKDLYNRSDAVQEVIGRPPRWLVQWGTLLIFAIVTALGWIGFFLEYPEFISGEILVQSTNPASSVVAPEERRIQELYFLPEDTVEAGTAVVVFANNARFQDVLNLESSMALVGELSDSNLLSFDPGRAFYLGDIQAELIDFLYNLDEFKSLNGSSGISEDPGYLNRTVTNIRQEVRKIRVRLDELNKEIDKSTDPVILAKLGQSKKDLLAALQEKQYQLDRLGQKSVTGKTAGERTAAGSRLRESFARLQNKLEDWKKEYLVIAPFRSIIRYNSRTVRKGGLVRANQEILQFVPLQPESLTGRMLLELGDASKVRKGQEVLIKLDNYAATSFGWLRGRITWKGSIPVDNSIPVEIYFPDGKRSTTGVNLDMGLEMTGKAQIVVSRKRILERVFGTFR
jgi:hypothetical protein